MSNAGQTCGAGGKLGALRGRGARQQRLEQLADHAEREFLLQFARARGQHLKAPRPGGAAHLPDQARLAQAGAALNDQQPPRAATCGGVMTSL